MQAAEARESERGPCRANSWPPALRPLLSTQAAVYTPPRARVRCHGRHRPARPLALCLVPHPAARRGRRPPGEDRGRLRQAPPRLPVLSPAAAAPTCCTPASPRLAARTSHVGRRRQGVSRTTSDLRPPPRPFHPLRASLALGSRCARAAPPLPLRCPFAAPSLPLHCPFTGRSLAVHRYDECHRGDQLTVVNAWVSL